MTCMVTVVAAETPPPKVSFSKLSNHGNHSFYPESSSRSGLPPWQLCETALFFCATLWQCGGIMWRACGAWGGGPTTPPRFLCCRGLTAVPCRAALWGWGRCLWRRSSKSLPVGATFSVGATRGKNRPYLDDVHQSEIMLSTLAGVGSQPVPFIFDHERPILCWLLLGNH